MNHVTSSAGTVPCDLCVITARDRRQAGLFQSQLRLLAERHELPAGMRWLVVTDPPGPPLGTGGATLHALCAAMDELCRSEQNGSGLALEATKLFIIHCGGQSQRLPQFAQLGKVFAPLPGRNGLPSSLLTEVIRSLATVSAPQSAGVFIACGDALYLCAPGDVEKMKADAVVYVCPALPSQAARHGVYGWDAATGCAIRVEQKPSPELQRALGLLTESGRAWLDTGVLALSPRFVQTWMETLGRKPRKGSWRELFRAARSKWEGLELYKDITGSLLPGGAAGHACLRRAFSGLQLHVAAPASGKFFHFGTTAELIDLLCGSQPYRAPATARDFSWIHPRIEMGAATLVQASVLESPQGSLGTKSLVHFSTISGRLELGGNNHVLGVHGTPELHLAPNTILYQAPVRTTGVAGDVLVTLGTQDNPKRDFAGREMSFLGDSMEAWLRERRVAEETLWPDQACNSRSLWNARIFPVGSPANIHLAAQWILHGSGHCAEGRNVWEALPRMSMAGVSQSFDASRWRAYERSLLTRLLTLQITETRDDVDLLSTLATQARSLGLLPHVVASLRRLARKSAGSLDAARFWQYASSLARFAERGVIGATEPSVLERDQQLVFKAVGAVVRKSSARKSPRRQVELSPGVRIRAEAPVRVDLAGGWTDTPPQALERGGSVLNVALELRGTRPIRTEVEIIPEFHIELCCQDAGTSTVVDDLRQLRGYTDPADPFCLHKAALFEAGLVSERGRDLRSRLQNLGGGLRITTDSMVPKGSGLGTSSILGATLVAALGAALDQRYHPSHCSNQVLRLEQRLTTGGGWQDQVGALTPGFKIARTSPGLNQSPHVTPVRIDDELLRELEQRLVLFYTGVPRLARNVLQRVVSRYLMGERAVVAALEEMPRLVGKLEHALYDGDLERVGACLDRSWELNKQVEPTASNQEIEQLFAAIQPWVLGAKLAGAGGGGFLFALARDREAAPKVVEALVRVGAPRDGHYPATVALSGLVLEKAGA